MPVILLVDKTGAIKEQSVKECTPEELYKKAKFKSGEGFECHTTWNLTQNGKQYAISLYGKTAGRAGQENKYEFPPPVDKLLFFGTCILLNGNADLTAKEWEGIYNTLYGGFEDIGEEDTDSDESANDEYADIPKTKVGYAKDGFVVDDDSSGDEEYIPRAKSSAAKKPASPRKKPASKKAKPVVEDFETQTFENEQLVCSNELEEEDYL